MRAFFSVLMVLYVSATISAQTLRTSNQYVAAIVEDGSGLITIRVAPGLPTDPVLSYPQKSFLTVMIGDLLFTNNTIGTNISPDPRLGGVLQNGINQKIADTIRTTWANKNGCDIIQDVFPVVADTGGVIVIRWSVKNNSAITPVWAQAQFMLDLEAGARKSDSALKVLTRYGYRNLWDQYNPASTYGLPWHFVTFENDVPEQGADHGLVGIGYNQDVNYRLGLKKPIKMTIGDWGAPVGIAIVDNLWGTSSEIPWGTEYEDAAVLYQWDGTYVPGDRTSEIAATAYGTRQIEFCEGKVLGLLLYPQRLQLRGNGLIPDTIQVDGYFFDPNSQGPPLPKVYTTLHTGENLRIIEPEVDNIDQHIQRQAIGPASGYIPQFNVGTAQWTVVAELENGSSVTNSWLKLIAEGEQSSDLLLDTCETPITILKGVSDVAVMRSDETFGLLPNPANDRTAIRIELQRPENVTIRLVDLSGRMVQRQQHSQLPAGITEIPIATGGLSAGMYYIFAEWDGKQQTKKLSVVR